MEGLLTAIQAQIAGLVANITQLFSDNIGSIFTVIGLTIVVSAALGLIKKMKGR